MKRTPMGVNQASWPFPYEDGQLLRIERGSFRGTIVRVDAGSSFWSSKAYYESDPSKGVLNEEGWQIVLDVERDGVWLYFVREHQDEVKRLSVEL